MSEIKCAQLHSELFRRRHSTRQSHGFFALAKHLFVRWLLCVKLFLCVSFLHFFTTFVVMSWVKVKRRSKLCEGQPLCHSALRCSLVVYVVFLLFLQELRLCYWNLLNPQIFFCFCLSVAMHGIRHICVCLSLRLSVCLSAFIFVHSL